MQSIIEHRSEFLIGNSCFFLSQPNNAATEHRSALFKLIHLLYRVLRRKNTNREIIS